MNNNLKIFDNDEFGEIRTLTINGAPWFVGKDVAMALGYSNSRKAIGDHVDDEDKGVTKCDTLGGEQDLTIINESGLYALIFGSNLESARRFKRWVTSEVLPVIRQTGGYGDVRLPADEIPVGEVTNLLKMLDRIAVREGLEPHVIARIFQQVAGQFGIYLPDDFVKVPEYVQSQFVPALDWE